MKSPTTNLRLQQYRPTTATMKCELLSDWCRKIIHADLTIASPQGWPGGHHHTGEIRGQEGSSHCSISIHSTDQAHYERMGDLPKMSLGCHHPAPRHRLKNSSISPRPRRRHRALPISNHPPHVKEASRKAIKGQAFHQDHQLQPPDAYAIHTGIGGVEGCGHERYVQGSQPEGGCEEDSEEGARRKIHEWKE